MRLRQIALVGADITKAKADIEAVLGLGEAYLDPGVAKYGLTNQVWPIGDTFLEVVSPQEAGTTAGRLLDKRGGDGGYMVLFQVDDIEVARARLAATGVRTVSQYDRDVVRMSHLHPKDIGGTIVSVDQMIPPPHWEWGGPDWKANVRTEVSVGITGCELQSDDPDALCARWSEVLGVPRDGDRLVMDDGGEVRFVRARDGRGEGLGAFDVAVHDLAKVRNSAQARGLLDAAGMVTLCGCRVNLVRA